MKISIRHNDKINLKQWDALIQQSFQSTVFHNSWFLELLDDDWSALLGENFNWVLPILSEKKHITSSKLIPYLGLVSKQHLPEKDFKKILSFLNKKFVSVRYTFSKYQIKYQLGNSFEAKEFFQKDLIKSYPVISKDFHEEVSNSLAVADKENLYCISLRSVFKFMEFLKEHSDYSEEELLLIRKIILRSTQLKAGKMYAAYNSTNELVGVTFIMFSKTKAYIMYSAFADDADICNADYKIINTILEELSLYNVTIENHSKSIDPALLGHFQFKPYYYFEYHHNTKQNLLSLLLQYLKP